MRSEDGLIDWEPPDAMTARPAYVLLVMEDLFFRKLLRRQLEASGYVVTEAISVERGLHRVHEVRPDVVLLDTWLDHGGGLRMLESLRSHDAYAALPVILLGNEVRKPVEARAKELGALGPLPLRDLEDVAAWVDEVTGGTVTDEPALDQPSAT
jgi:PleD family two-component response regulator